MVILIVEDEFFIGWALKLILQIGGHDAVGPAVTADEAMHLAHIWRPELAFVDITIQGDLDGLALARALTETHGISCIFLTERPDRAREAKDAALGVVSKPYDPRDLLTAVDVVTAIRDGRTPTAVPRHLELFQAIR